MVQVSIAIAASKRSSSKGQFGACPYDLTLKPAGRWAIISADGSTAVDRQAGGRHVGHAASGSCALGSAWRRQRFEDARGQPGARIPDLDRDKLVAGGIVVSEATRHPLADDVVGLAGREPGDVGV
jgi:hypothetical protein